jgi:hypothetical protein
MSPDYETEYAHDGLVILDEAPRKNGNGANRYTYRVGAVQKVISEVVLHPNKWVLARRDSPHRTAFASALSKYKQLRWCSRKNDNGLIDIWVSYTPNPDGSMDGRLDADIQSWKAREVAGRDRPDVVG